MDIIKYYGSKENNHKISQVINESKYLDICKKFKILNDIQLYNVYTVNNRDILNRYTKDPNIELLLDKNSIILLDDNVLKNSIEDKYGNYNTYLKQALISYILYNHNPECNIKLIEYISSYCSGKYDNIRDISSDQLQNIKIMKSLLKNRNDYSVLTNIVKDNDMYKFVMQSHKLMKTESIKVSPTIVTPSKKIIIPEPKLDIPKKIIIPSPQSNGFYSHNGYWNGILVKDNKVYREQCECLIFLDNMVYLESGPNSYKLANKGTVSDTALYDQIENLCKSIVKTKIDSINYIDSYEQDYDKINVRPKWEWNSLVQFNGTYNHLFIAEYDEHERQAFISDINDYADGKLYNISDIYHRLNSHHKKAVDYYIQKKKGAI